MGFSVLLKEILKEYKIERLCFVRYLRIVVKKLSVDVNVIYFIYVYNF